MKLSEIKKILPTVETVAFSLPNGDMVPGHFHVTEVGSIEKNFIDCGGTVRSETVVNFQLWNAADFDHRLKPAKLLKIIELSEKTLGIDDHEIEVEYQTDTIGKYGLEFDGQKFTLLTKTTVCLASNACGIPQKPNVSMAQLAKPSEPCTPGGGCC